MLYSQSLVRESMIKRTIEQVKEILFHKLMKASNKFLFETVEPKIGHKLRVRTYK